MTVALVCGGRWYGRVPIVTAGDGRELAARASKEVFILRETLDHLRRERAISMVIAGGQAGADEHAIEWASSRCVAFRVFRAEWKRLGKAAGPIRNARMLADGKPDFVVAFAGGSGTADMIRKAEAAGVEVIDLRTGE